ncbi:MAG: 4-hydroxythreonine-4-phosphate dehydrogenase PdxA, partial [Candidatus Omnitrophica bacterium]|nr:4-hydroxythreonine-4-phosphate dehydrogenase PdxA [Candidatus Omnitrophota bacterium]
EENAAKSVLVTAPVSKERIAEISPGFVGHTEYLREADGADMVTMVLTGESMCVVPVTRHIPLGDVTKHINEEYLFKTLVQVVDNRELITGKRDPKIAVAALNPHAGEGGKIGTEEKEIIMPAIERAKKVYPEIEGPVPADVVFYKAVKKEYDIVVSMYHDQCLAPFKMLDFDSGVNVTLGLGYVRTSPDHGTAFDIAGKGIANPRSMIEAIKLAVRAVT